MALTRPRQQVPTVDKDRRPVEGSAPFIGAPRVELLASAIGNRAFAQFAGRQRLAMRQISPQRVPREASELPSAARDVALLQREALADDPYPATEDGEQPGLFSLSDEGFEFLTQHEGVKLELYNDSQGHCTIGVGHLVHKGKCDGSESKEFKDGLTKDKVFELFRQDLVVYEAAVSNGVKSRLNQYQYDALVSFTFNVGTGAFLSSGVLKEMNAKNYSKVPGELLKWIKPAEIAGRRKDEAKLFKTGQY